MHLVLCICYALHVNKLSAFVLLQEKACTVAIGGSSGTLTRSHCSAACGAYLCLNIRLEVIGQQVVVRPMCDAVQNIRKEVLIAKHSSPDHVHCCLKLRIQLQSVRKNVVLVHSLGSMVSSLYCDDQTVRV